MKGFYGCLLTVFLVVGLASVSSLAQSVNVTTWHNDIGRTGQNTHETTLTTGINKTNFGRVCSYKLLLNEQVYAQPLVLGNIVIGGTQHQAVLVLTMQDNIYVFDGANHTGAKCNLLQGPIRLLPSNEATVDCKFINCGAISYTMGVLGTPVIDPATNTLYVVTHSQWPKKQPSKFYHRLHALDLTSPTLAEKYNGPATLPSVKVGSVTFQSKVEIQRPGLLLLTGEEPAVAHPMVYAAFSTTEGTRPNPSGWIFGYDAQNLKSSSSPLVYATTSGKPDVKKRHGGGIWQGAGGLSAGGDQNGGNYIYFSTADGQFDNPLTTHGNGGNSFLKLTPQLQVSDYFTPADAFYRWDSSCHEPEGWDLDFGSGSAVVVPPDPHMNSAYQHVAIKADKENYLWVIDRTSPGRFVGQSCGCTCTVQNTNVIQQLAVPSAYQAHSTPAFWDDGSTPFLYYAPTYGPLSKYPLNCGPDNGPICAATATAGTILGYSPTPAVSSNGTTKGTGIVWVIDAVGGNALMAFDAETMARLYSSNDCHNRDKIGLPTSFSVPTIANGHVFVGTRTDFDIFGPTTASCN